MKITIEQLQLDELQSFLREQADDTFPDLKDEQRLAMLSEKWHSHAEFCTCRNDEGRLVGMIAFYANRPEEKVVYIPHVYVSGQFRGQQLMTSMLHIIEEYVQGKGFKYLRLEVKRNNEMAQRAYLHYGFSRLMEAEASDNSFFMQYSIS